MKFKFKPLSTIVSQSPAGVEVTAILEEGVLYLPVCDLKEAFKGSPELKPLSEDKLSKAPVKKDSAEKIEKDEPVEDLFTEKELMDMSTKELIKICKEKDIEIPAEGKNTNKKLRDLILAYQDDNVSDSADSDESSDEDVPEGFDDVCEILEKVDGGELNHKKALEKLLNAVSHDNEKHVDTLLTTFETDEKADLESIAEQICVPKTKGKGKKSSDEDEEDDDEKPSKRAKGRKTVKSTLVEIEDLEVGDKVNVFWLDEDSDTEGEYYKGEVSSIKKGKVTVDYEDGSSEILDPEVNTKIELLS